MPSCIRSKASLIFSSGMVWVIRSSMLILPLHVPVDDLRHVGAAARAAEGRALPDAAGDELERPRRDFLARGRDADDDALAPAAMAAFQRLAHDVDIADAFEGVVGAAAGEVDDRLHDLVAADLVRD